MTNRFKLKIKLLWSVLLSLCLCVFFAKSWAFDAGEHAVIGDLAFENINVNSPNTIKSLELDIDYRYGHLVALLGDMYKSVEEIALADPVIVDGYFGRNRQGLKNCVDREIYSIKNNLDYSGCGDFKLIEKKSRYLTLAHDNFTHFAWHNIKQYIEYHERALWFAELAYNKCTKELWESDKHKCEAGKKTNKQLIAQSSFKDKLSFKHRKLPKLFPRRQFTKLYFEDISKQKMSALALFTNAYADHFLTDTFSAGHLRVPRSQIDAWVKAYEKNPQASIEGYSEEDRKKGSTVSGALTQFLHHRDGGVHGIEVTNSMNARFRIRGDKQLFSMVGAEELSGKVAEHQRVQYPVAAVEDSLREIFSVLEQGAAAKPVAEFAALRHVPYIMDKTDTLKAMVENELEVFGSVKEVIKSMPLEMALAFRARCLLKKIQYDRYFSDFIDAIPGMMAELRLQISEESQEFELSRRIPAQLLMALKSLN